MNKQLIELLLGTDVLLKEIMETQEGPLAAVLLTIRVKLAEYFHQHLTDEARAYFKEGYPNPAELVKIIPKFREKSGEVLTLLRDSASVSDYFYLSLLEGKIITNKSELKKEEGE